MKQGSCSIFCAGTFMIHHDSVLFQKAGTTGLRTGPLSSIIVLYISPGAPLEFPSFSLSPASLLPVLDSNHSTKGFSWKRSWLHF